MGEGPQFAELEPMRRNLAAGADLCVVPSVWQEAFCHAALEGTASGKALIASNVGAIPEIIKSAVDGILVPPGDEKALAEVIRVLLLDPARASWLGQAAQRHVDEAFNPEKQPPSSSKSSGRLWGNDIQ